MSDIVIRGAREHNLNDVNLRVPRNRLICFTGVSGSGKSSLAFDTLYAEGQRRYVESLSSYARQFLGQLPKPDVDFVSGLSPAVSISQKTAGQNARSTVGTITEISDFLRVLFARVAVGYCPKCGRKIEAQTRAQILERLRETPDGVAFQILAPIARNQKGRCSELLSGVRKRGFRNVRIDGRYYSVDDDVLLDRQSRHSIDVVIDRIEKSDATSRRLEEGVDLALSLGKGRLIVSFDDARASTEELVSSPNASAADVSSDVESNVRSEEEANRRDFFARLEDGKGFDVDFSKVVSGVRAEADELEQDSDSAIVLGEPIETNEAPTVATSSETGEIYFSSDYACSHCGLSFERPTPQLFSFNSVQGMCPRCQGLGRVRTFDPKLLIPDESKSFQQGCFLPIGKWQDLGKWRQHVYQGIADALENLYSLEKNYVLETAWEELDERVKRGLLWGVGDLRVTYSWQNGANSHKWGGTFEGIIPRMLKQYQETTNKTQLAAMERFMNVVPCGYCQGARLNEQARAFRIDTNSSSPVFANKKSFSLPELSNLSISDLLEFFSDLNLTETGRTIARDLVKEICKRLRFLLGVGLDYLSLGRSAPTLSGGEMQRIRLAGQIGGGLVGVLYVLDEPSIGLHPRDNEKLIATLTELRDLGNTVVVVEHDEDTMLASDFLVDFGPGPGVHGGQIVASGPVDDVLKNQREGCLTAKFLAGDEEIETPRERKRCDDRRLIIRGVTHNNLKNIDVEIPLGGVVCVTGVSGSGKSSLVNDVLKEVLAQKLNRAIGSPGAYKSIEGVENLSKLISIDQTPIGRTPRSNPATYVKLFDEIRKLYSETPDARTKGFTPGRFSFNVAGGRCEACEGAGATRLEMDFLADVWATCAVCGGKRFNKETLAVKYKGLSIDQVLDMDVESALKHFENIPKICEKLQTLYDVGLGYMKLGQPSPTLSGGEAQRVKLAKELVKKSFGKTIYLLDEPTTGLHFEDARVLLKVLRNFADAGNTVLIVEHNLDVIKTADWIIDLGPEGGARGGYVVATGTPEQIAANPDSYTGRALKEFMRRDRKALARALEEKRLQTSRREDAEQESENEEGAVVIKGACEHNLQNVSVEIPRNKTTVCCGPSGSGKSSLAVDVVYAEGRRRYVESLSSYARQFLGQIQKPKIEHASGISPSIAIEQKTTRRSPRSTVGTVTEINDYLRIVFARVGAPYCPECDVPVGTQSTDEIVARVMSTRKEQGTRLLLTAPIAPEQGESYAKLWERLQTQGFTRVRVDRETFELDNPPSLTRKTTNEIEIVVDRLNMKRTDDEDSENALRRRVAGSVETALACGKGEVRVVTVDEDKDERDWNVQTLSQKLSCEKCGRAFEPLTPRHFSFNSPLGWCPRCEGLGVETGANPQTFVRDPKLSLMEGAISVWSDFESPLTFATLKAFGRTLDVPLDAPFERLDARFRRIIFRGTGDRWFDVLTTDFPGAQRKDSSERGTVVFRFQYKGIYPATEEAGRLAPYYRSRLEYQVNERECSECLGSRLRDDVAAVRFHNQTIDQLCRAPLKELIEFFNELEPTPLEKQIVGDLLDEIKARIQFLIDVGLEYLTLARPAPSLSGGEAQRIRLAAQIGSGLVGVLYVLDEPTIGLHSKDTRRLISALNRLRDLGNTLLIVEHDQEVVESADNIIDFGPRAGTQGGTVVATGTPEEVKKNPRSVTGPYLSGRLSIPIPVNRRVLT